MTHCKTPCNTSFHVGIESFTINNFLTECTIQVNNGKYLPNLLPKTPQDSRFAEVHIICYTSLILQYFSDTKNGKKMFVLDKSILVLFPFLLHLHIVCLLGFPKLLLETDTNLTGLYFSAPSSYAYAPYLFFSHP